MNSRRAFLCSLPVMTAGVATAQITNHVTFDGVEFAKTVEEVKKSLWAVKEWKEVEFRDDKFLFALVIFGAGQPAISVQGWVYNSRDKEWCRILIVKTSLLGDAKLRFEAEQGVVSLHGAGFEELKDVEVFRFDLRALSNPPRQVK